MRTTLRKLTVTWPLVIFLLHPALARAETAVQAWVQAYNGTTNLYAAAHTVAVDSSNNVIVAGESTAPDIALVFCGGFWAFFRESRHVGARTQNCPLF